MAKRLVLLDFRLTGMVSADVGEVMQVSVRTPLKEAFDKVATRARALGGLDDLLICCHGFESVIEDYDGQVSFMSGGFGLELCAENLKLANVGVTAVLKDPPPLVKRIVVFSCAAADTHRASKRVGGDSKRLMGEIALTTGARVVASSATQFFAAIPSIAQSLFNAGSRNDWRIDFGDWEGDVFEFSPDDGHGRKLSPDKHPHFDF
jgi:hypothetical protein